MERKEVIKILKQWICKISQPIEEQLGWVEGYVTKEDMEAFEMAVNSLETDEAYQLEYEKPSGKWKQINKNEVNVIPQWKCSECGAEFECFDMDFEYCPMCGCSMEEEE